LVYNQIFLERGYQCLDSIRDPQLIIDCGANVGFSAAFFLTRHARAKLIAIEPEKSNFHLLKRNVARFGSRVRTIHGGVWSHRCGLKVERLGYRDGREWSVRVRESQPGERTDIEAFDVGSLLSQSGCDRISILKIDIERSELEVFKNGNLDW